MVFLAPPFLVMPSSYHRTTSPAKRKVACAAVFHSFFNLFYSLFASEVLLFTLIFVFVASNCALFFFFFFKDCLSTHFLEYYLALFFFLLSAEEPSEDVFATHLYYCYYPLQKNVVGQYKRNYVERWCALFLELNPFFFFGLTRVVHSSPQSVLLLFSFFFSLCCFPLSLNKFIVT